MIQVLKPKFHVEACMEQIRECLEKGWTGMGYKTIEFENAWKQYTGHRNALFLNSNTAGLYMALQIMKMQYGWTSDSEVISTPITFIVTNHAILKNGLVPRFADVDEFLCLDPVDLEKKINEKTRAVLFVGYGGRVGRLEEIVRICKAYGLHLILDAAHMAGTRVNGVCPGTWDGIDVTVYSFQAVKNLPTADSGMICFDSDAFDAIARKLSWLGINKDTYSRSNRNQEGYRWNYDVEYVGQKDHGNSIMAAIALAQLPYLDEENAYRRQLVQRYNALLQDHPDIRIIPSPYPDECAYHLYEIAVPDRESVLAALAEREIYGGVHYRDNSEYRMYASQRGTTPNAHLYSEHILTLPLNLWMQPEDIDLIADIVKTEVERQGDLFV